jgi:hypothetical protein
MKTFKIYLETKLFIESIQQQFNISLSETLKIADDIKKIAQRANLKIPDVIKNIDEIDKTENKEILNVKKQNKVQPTKTGKVFKMLFSDLPDHEISKLVSNYYALFEDYRFIIDKDVYKWYRNRSVETCLNTPTPEEDGNTNCIDEPKQTILTKLYNNLPDVKIVVLLEKEKYVGRALLWEKVIGLDKPFLDIIYPNDNNKIVTAFIEHAKNNGWYFKKTQSGYDITGITNGNNGSYKKISYVIKDAIRKAYNGVMPYIDTFRYGEWINDNDIKITNDLTSISNKDEFMVFDEADGTDLNYNERMDNENFTRVLMTHIIGGDLETVKFFKDKYKLPPIALSASIMSGSLDMVKYIVELGTELAISIEALDDIEKPRNSKIKEYLSNHYGKDMVDKVIEYVRQKKKNLQKYGAKNE